MTIYTTPLQFGYFFSLALAVLFWVRARSEERLSDSFLGWVLFFVAMQLQDYTFGFAGINILWTELNGFPRGVDLLFGPAVYFYLKSQTNRDFALQKNHFLHLLPWLIYFSVEFSVFVMGKGAVTKFQNSILSDILEGVHYVVRIVSLTYYLWSSLKIYKAYRTWSQDQFSDTETISFRWFRNFLYFMIVWLVCRELMFGLDEILELSFYQDWWWNLPLVVTAFYVGLQGYSQPQPLHISFSLSEKNTLEETIIETPKAVIQKQWDQLIELHKYYLQPELSLNELSQHLGENARELSNAIKQDFGLNFNDYINRKRVAAFEEKIAANEQDQFTLLSLGYESGFNSKATFHRAFKKHKGCTPKEFVEQRKS